MGIDLEKITRAEATPRLIRLGGAEIKIELSLADYVDQTVDVARKTLVQAGQFNEARSAHPFILEPAAFVVCVWADEQMAKLEARIAKLELLAKMAAKTRPIEGFDVEAFLKEETPPDIPAA